MLTVYGIETLLGCFNTASLCLQVATVLTVYGIETESTCSGFGDILQIVATVLTVYGIETLKLYRLSYH